MSRLTFPSAGDQLVYAVTGTDAPILAKSGLSLRVYTDLACTTLADIQSLAGTTLTNSVITVDSNSLLPLFLGPDTDADTLYVRPTSLNTGNGSPIYAREDDRLDLINAAVATKVSKTGGDTITSSGPSVKGLVLKGATGQTANLAEFQNSAGTVLALVGPSGFAKFAETLTVGPDAQDGSVQVFSTTKQATQRGLVVRGAAGQTANLQEWQSSDGTVRSSINSAGWVQGNIVNAGAAANDGTVALFTTATGPTQRPLLVRGAASQTANLQEWQNNAGTPLGYISAAGSAYFSTTFFLPNGSEGGEARWNATPGDPNQQDFVIDVAGNPSAFRILGAAAGGVLATFLRAAQIGINQTALEVLTKNSAGTESVHRVVIGAADSAGAGFRTLRIPN